MQTATKTDALADFESQQTILGCFVVILGKNLAGKAFYPTSSSNLPIRLRNLMVRRFNHLVSSFNYLIRSGNYLISLFNLLVRSFDYLIGRFNHLVSSFNLLGRKRHLLIRRFNHLSRSKGVRIGWGTNLIFRFGRFVAFQHHPPACVFAAAVRP